MKKQKRKCVYAIGIYIMASCTKLSIMPESVHNLAWKFIKKKSIALNCFCSFGNVLPIIYCEQQQKQSPLMNILGRRGKPFVRLQIFFYLGMYSPAIFNPHNDEFKYIACVSITFCVCFVAFIIFISILTHHIFTFPSLFSFNWECAYHNQML